MNLAIVMDALQSAKTSDIPSLAKALSSAELDLLVKFLYRGMAQPETFNSLILLAWHEKVCPYFCQFVTCLGD